ncbi:MAG: alpha/beta fold hydrolase [Clostridia bacterium]|nr:alpha/beta fold hydrolase [Clostridia bacterium]
MAVQFGVAGTGAAAMEYFRFGTGKRTMVILPGLSVQSVLPFAGAVAQAYDVLTRDFTVYLFERRKDLPPTYQIDDMARDTAAALEALGLRDVCLFGASQGGMIAMTLAVSFPALVKKLAIGSTAADIQEAQMRVIARWIDLAKAQDGVGLYLDFGRHIYPPETFESYRAALTAAGKRVTAAEFERFTILAAGTQGFSVLDRLGEIRCPVLAIGATDDAVLGCDATRRIAQAFAGRPDFEVYYYTGCGHAAYDTAPDYKARLLRFFLADEAEDAAT